MAHGEPGCTEVDARNLAERYLSRRITPAQCRFFEAHFLVCDRCREEVRLCAAIRSLLGGWSPHRSPHRSPRRNAPDDPPSH